jgi:hypothetical protein
LTSTSGENYTQQSNPETKKDTLLECVNGKLTSGPATSALYPYYKCLLCTVLLFSLQNLV